MPAKNSQSLPCSLLAGEQPRNPLQAPKATLWTAVLAIAALFAGTWLYIAFKAPEPTYSIAKTIRYSFLVTNNAAEYIDSASLKVFAPVKQNSYQRINQISANQQFETEIDQSGNQSLLFKLKGLAPHASRVISITADISLSSKPQQYGDESDSYLAPEPNIEVNAPEIRELADKLTQDKEGIQQIASWLYKNVSDIGYIAEDRGARYAITEKRGDCTEFASAFVALARASGVPSKMVGGFTLEHSGKLQADNYHNWAEFGQGDAWSIADPQNNIVDSGYGSYIAFYNFDEHSRLENSQRFLSYDQRLKVQML
ncbi:transglutaminase-like domain-containing protein [Microbulbifer sp.]|uniref:transglutaminase-like domain-containing protein n=1 Tax=Microbulbifer sp. TaxID=1908541 RepID=UPI003F378086